MTQPDYGTQGAFFQNAGPQTVARQAFAPEVHEETRGRLREITVEFNQADDGAVRIRSAYLVAVARKRG